LAHFIFQYKIPQHPLTTDPNDNGRKNVKCEIRENVTMVFQMAVTDLIRGSLFCLLWYSSICSGFFALCVPLIPLLFISPISYRHGIDAIFAMWELYPVVISFMSYSMISQQERAELRVICMSRH